MQRNAPVNWQIIVKSSVTRTWRYCDRFVPDVNKYVNTGMESVWALYISTKECVFFLRKSLTLWRTFSYRKGHFQINRNVNAKWRAINVTWLPNQWKANVCKRNHFSKPAKWQPDQAALRAFHMIETTHHLSNVLVCPFDFFFCSHVIP